MARKSKRGSPRLSVPNAERASPKIDLAKYDMQPSDVLKILQAYLREAQDRRLSGPSSRELTWWNHVDLYWNRFDFAKKASWQSREVMPEVPQFVDRFAASMREALTATDEFFTVEAPYDDEDDLANAIKKLMTLWLKRCGRDPLGHPISFDAVFEELMKLGALMTVCAVVVQKGQGDKAYTAIEPLDPRTVWLDTSGRNLYRIRRYEIEKSDLVALARLTDKGGNGIYDLDQITMLTADVMLKERWEREKLTGEGQFDTSTRTTITLDEYLCTLISPTGEQIGTNLLCVVANDMFLIRGPELNPFWHDQDWIVEAPLVNAPLSVYGRSYVENMATIAATFNELTNLILDGVFTTAMKAFAANAYALDDPTQLDEGIWPNKIFKLADGMTMPKEFLQEIDLGQLPPEAIQVWQAIKQELQEAAAQNDITMGQMAPKGRTSSTEIQSVQNQSAAPLRSIAKTVEQRILEPLLDIFWKTGLQHMQKNDKIARQLIGDSMYDAIYKNRKQFAQSAITFHCRGISALISRQQKLQQLMSMLQVIAQNQQLMQVFLQQISPARLLDLLFKLFDIDKTELEPTERELLIAQLTQPPAVTPGAAAAPGSMAPLPAPNPVAASHVATPVSNAAPVQ